MYAFSKKMDIDIKVFFEDPPRIKDEVKVYVRDFCATLLERLLQHCILLFGDERVTARHVKLLILLLTNEPLTMYERETLLVENSKLAHVSRVLCRAIEHSLNAMEDSKYANLNKKFYKECMKIIKEEDSIQTNTSGNVALVSVVSEVCGILLNCSLQEMRQEDVNGKTLHRKHVTIESVYHTTSDGERLPFKSFMHFIHVVQTFEPQLDGTKESKVQFG